MGRVLRDHDHHAEYLPGRGGVATYEGPQTNLISVGGTPISQGMKVAGGVVTNIDPEKGFEVQTSDGKSVWISSNFNPRLLPYLNGGNLDLNAAVKAGIDSVQDYGGLGITEQMIKAIKDGVPYIDAFDPNNQQPNLIIVNENPQQNKPFVDQRRPPRDTTTKPTTKTETITEKVDNSAAISNIEQAIEQTNEQKEIAKADVSAKQVSINDLQNAMQTMTREIADRRKNGQDTSKQQKALDSLVENFNKLNNELKASQDAVARADDTIKGYNDQIDKLSNQTRTVTRTVSTTKYEPNKDTGTYYGDAQGYDTAGDSRFGLFDKPTTHSVTSGDKVELATIKPSDESDLRVLDPRYVQFEIPSVYSDLYGQDQNFTRLVDETQKKINEYNDLEERLAQLRLIMNNTNSFIEPRYVDRSNNTVVFTDKDGVIGAKGKEWTTAELSDLFYTDYTKATREAKQDIGKSLDSINSYRNTLTKELKTTQDALKSKSAELSTEIGQLLKSNKNTFTEEIKNLQNQKEMIDSQWRDVRSLKSTLTTGKLNTEDGVKAADAITKANDTIALSKYYKTDGQFDIIQAVQDGASTKSLQNIGFSTDSVNKVNDFLNNHTQVDGEWYTNDDAQALNDFKASTYLIGDKYYAKTDIDNIINQYPEQAHDTVRSIIFNDGLDAYKKWANNLATDYAWAKSGYSKKDTNTLNEKYTTPEGNVDLDKLYISGNQNLLDKVQLLNADGSDMTREQKQALFQPYKDTEKYIKSLDVDKEIKNQALNMLKIGGIDGFNKWVNAYNKAVDKTTELISNLKISDALKDIWGDEDITAANVTKWWKKFPDRLGDSIYFLADESQKALENIANKAQKSVDEAVKNKEEDAPKIENSTTLALPKELGGLGVGGQNSRLVKNTPLYKAGTWFEEQANRIAEFEEQATNPWNYYENWNDTQVGLVGGISDLNKNAASKEETVQFGKGVKGNELLDSNKPDPIFQTGFKGLREVTINNIHDLGIITHLAASKFAKGLAGDEDAPGEIANLGVNLASYYFTLPGKMITDPINGIAEALGVFLPTPKFLSVGGKISTKISDIGKVDSIADTSPKLLENQLNQLNQKRIDINTDGKTDPNIDSIVNSMPKREFLYDEDKFTTSFNQYFNERLENNKEVMIDPKDLEKYNKDIAELDSMQKNLAYSSGLLQEDMQTAYKANLQAGVLESRFNDKVGEMIEVETSSTSPVQQISEAGQKSLLERRKEKAMEMADDIIKEANSIATKAPERVAASVTPSTYGQENIRFELIRETKILDEFKDYLDKKGIDTTDLDVKIAQAKERLDTDKPEVISTEKGLVTNEDALINQSVDAVYRMIDESDAKANAFNEAARMVEETIHGSMTNKDYKNVIKFLTQETRNLLKESKDKNYQNILDIQRRYSQAGKIKMLVQELKTRISQNLGIADDVYIKIYTDSIIDALNDSIIQPPPLLELDKGTKAANKIDVTGIINENLKKIDNAPITDADYVKVAEIISDALDRQEKRNEPKPTKTDSEYVADATRLQKELADSPAAKPFDISKKYTYQELMDILDGKGGSGSKTDSTVKPLSDDKSTAKKTKTTVAVKEKEKVADMTIDELLSELKESTEKKQIASIQKKLQDKLEKEKKSLASRLKDKLDKAENELKRLSKDKVKNAYRIAELKDAIKLARETLKNLYRSPKTDRANKEQVNSQTNLNTKEQIQTKQQPDTRIQTRTATGTSFEQASPSVQKLSKVDTQTLQTTRVVTPSLVTADKLTTTEKTVIDPSKQVDPAYRFVPATKTTVELDVPKAPKNTKEPETPKTPRKPKGPGKPTNSSENMDKTPNGQIAWRQGSLKIDGKIRPVWIVLDFKNGQPVKRYVFQTPKGAKILKRTPKETVYTTGKNVKKTTVDVGNMTVSVDPSSSQVLKFSKKMPNNKTINKMSRSM